MLENLAVGVQNICNLSRWLIMLGGVTLGIIFGAMPA
jgi:TctA family transporter